MQTEDTQQSLTFLIEDLLTQVSSRGVDHFNQHSCLPHTALLVELLPDGTFDLQPIPNGAKMFFGDEARKREEELAERLFQSISSDKVVGILTVSEAWGTLTQKPSIAGGPRSRIEPEKNPLDREELLVFQLRMRSGEIHVHALKMRAGVRAFDHRPYIAPRDSIQAESRPPVSIPPQSRSVH